MFVRFLGYVGRFIWDNLRAKELFQWVIQGGRKILEHIDIFWLDLYISVCCVLFDIMGWILLAIKVDFQNNRFCYFRFTLLLHAYYNSQLTVLILHPPRRRPCYGWTNDGSRRYCSKSTWPSTKRSRTRNNSLTSSFCLGSFM